MSSTSNVIGWETDTSAPNENLSTTLRQKQRQSREDAILDAALDLIAANGYDTMTMEDLAERVGISKPTLYQHFPSKEAIAVRAMVRRMGQCLSFIESLDSLLPPTERLNKMVRWVLESKFVSRESSWPTMRDAAASAVKTHPEYRSSFQQMIAVMSGVVEEAKASGDVNKELNTRVLVQMVFSLVRDYEYQEILLAGECTPTELTQTLVSTYMSGIMSVRKPG